MVFFLPQLFIIFSILDIGLFFSIVAEIIFMNFVFIGKFKTFFI